MSDIFKLVDSEQGASKDYIEFTPKDFEHDLKRQGCSLTLFVGAGFSMAWNEKYPNGNQLFAIDKKDIERYRKYSFVSLAESFNLKWLSQDEGHELEKLAEVFCNLKFQIDIYKKYPTLLPSYIDKSTIKHVEASVGLFVKDRLEGFVGKKELSMNLDKRLPKSKKAIFKFFESLKERTSGLSFITTNYDLVLDRLIVNTGLEPQPIRGIFDESSFQSQNWCPKLQSCSLFKLNGGLEIYPIDNEFRVIYENVSLNEKSPKVIVPSKEQSYTDNYFKSIFVKACNKLRDSNRLIFIGYSLPEEDHVIKFLLQSFVDTEVLDKEIYIIDHGLENALKVKDKLVKLFPTLANNEAIKVFNGTFNEFCEYQNQ